MMNIHHSRKYLNNLYAAVIALIITPVTSNIQAAWTDITGIPQPSFGVTEVAPERPSNWSTEVVGFYYVEPSNVEATDSGNVFGTPAMPRASIPDPIPAGSVVELHGRFDSRVTVNALGTPSDPVFLRGSTYDSRPTLGLEVFLNGSYLITENIKTEPRDASVGNGSSGFRIKEGSEFITVRNSEVSGLGNNNRTGGLSIGTWSYAGTDIVNNILIDNLDVHDIGNLNATYDQDGHGVTIHGNAQNIWVTNNSMTRNSGDGVQIEAQHNRGREHIHHIYLGNNTAFNNKQTGLWVKHARDVIISGNEIYDIHRSDSSSGACTGYQYSADNLWFINNKLHNCYQGIYAASGDPGEQTSVYYIGNTIFNINSDMPANPHQAGGITIRMSSANHFIVNNTIDDTDIGLSIPISSGNIEIANNIISGRNEPSGWDIYIEAIATNTTADNNVIHHSNGISISWNWTNHSSLSSLFSASGQCGSCIEMDPLLKPSHEIDITSPALNSAEMSNNDHVVYSIFTESYGLDIRQDAHGTPRPQQHWDIGAFELDLPPLPPSNVSKSIRIN